MKRLLLFLLFIIPTLIYSQNKVFDNVDVNSNLYIGGDMKYKNEIFPSATTIQSTLDDSIAAVKLLVGAAQSALEDSSEVITGLIPFEWVDGVLSLSGYTFIDDTVTGTLINVNDSHKAYSSDDSYCILNATGSDSSSIEYTFDTIDLSGDVVGAYISIEYKMRYDTGSVYNIYFTYSGTNYTGLENHIPMHLATDTTIEFGGLSNLLGLDNLLDSLQSNNIVSDDYYISNLISDPLFSIEVYAEDSVLSIDAIKVKFYVASMALIDTKEDSVRVEMDYLRLTNNVHPPIDPQNGLIYRDTDGTIYNYLDGTWRSFLYQPYIIDSLMVEGDTITIDFAVNKIHYINAEKAGTLNITNLEFGYVGNIIILFNEGEVTISFDDTVYDCIGDQIETISANKQKFFTILNYDSNTFITSYKIPTE